MNCNFNCKTNNCICKKAIFSTSVTVVTVDGTDTLLIDIPTSTYFDGCQYCLFITQAIPSTATINMPVAVSIGGVTTTVYPLVKCDCSQVTACAIRTRKRYPVRVSTSGTGGVFKVLYGLSCSPNNSLASLPVAAVAAATPTTQSFTPAVARTTAKKTTLTKPSTVDNLTVNAANITVNKERK